MYFVKVFQEIIYPVLSTMHGSMDVHAKPIASYINWYATY